MDVLSDYGPIATHLDLLRVFVNKAQSDRVMQTFRSALQGTLQHIDNHLYTLEQNIIVEERGAPATLLQFFASLSDIVEVSGSVAGFVTEIHSKNADVVGCLELLFDQACRLQASGNEPGFQCLSKLFIQSFQAYFRPLRDWMDQGMLHEDQAIIFVTATGLGREPSGLWQKWYKVADDCAPNRCPNFLQFVKAKIFSIGKTVVFLQRLNANCEIYKDSCSLLLSQEPDIASASSLLPFSELLASSLQDFVESRLQVATSTLRDYLGNSCGLWMTLDALNCVNFGRIGYITDLVDMKIFTSIDRCDRNWNDRFLLSDLLQTVFEPVECVETERLALGPGPYASRNMSCRWRSVQLLSDLRIQYTLHWSLANVISTPSLVSYSRVSTFLMQIRRARYVLERRSLLQVREGRLTATPQERNLNQLLHHNLLLFINILYSHLTSLVIEEANLKLRKGLAGAADIDAMIAAHNTYCNELEAACLTSKSLRPIHDQIISILNLCIHFSDLNNPRRTRTSTSDADVRSYASATSHQRRRRRPDREDSSSDESDSGEGYTTFMVSEDSTLMDQLRNLRAEFERKLSFVVAGLNSIGRVREQETYWEILGSRLEWKRSTF